MIIRANASLMIFFFISANIKFSVSPLRLHTALFILGVIHAIV